MPEGYIVSLLSDTKAFERACKYIKDPSLLVDLQWTNPGKPVDQRNNNNQIIGLAHKVIHII